MGLRKVRLPAILLVLTAFGLASCEEHQIVKRRVLFTQKMLMEMPPTGGILVERHGLPWRSATPEETVGTLRMPAGSGSNMRFLPSKPGSALVGDGQRLVLHFNPVGGPDAAADCTATEERKTGTSRGGFRVSATYCEGGTWLVHSSMWADAAEQDWLAYFLTMQEFLGGMFPDK